MEVQFLYIAPTGNIGGLVDLKGNMTLCEIWIRNDVGWYTLLQKCSLYGGEELLIRERIPPSHCPNNDAVPYLGPSKVKATTKNL